MASILSLLVCSILVWVLVEDLRRFKVRNSAVILLVVCFGLDCLVRNRVSSIAPHAFFAAIGLALMVGAFALRMIGGGDAKLLSAALLWVGPEGLLVFAFFLFACTIIYAAGAWAGMLPARQAGKRTIIPFGPSIATAWIAQIGLRAWL